MKMNKRVVFLIIAGCFISATGFHFFADKINLVNGGVGGIAIILANYFNVNTGVLVFILNVFFMILGLIVLGKHFFYKTVIGSLFYPGFIIMWEIIERYYTFNIPTDDIMLLTLLASISVGGVGMVMRAGGSTGGLDIPQVILNQKLGVPMNTAVYLTDGIIVLCGVFAFGLEIGLYALLSLFLNGIAIDRALIGRPKKVVQIITNVGNENQIKDIIYRVIDRGVTEVNALGGYTLVDKKMLICTMDSKEFIRIRDYIYEIDPYAFIYITASNEVLGRGWTHDKDFGVAKE